MIVTSSDARRRALQGSLAGPLHSAAAARAFCVREQYRAHAALLIFAIAVCVVLTIMAISEAHTSFDGQAPMGLIAVIATLTTGVLSQTGSFASLAMRVAERRTHMSYSIPALEFERLEAWALALPQVTPEGRRQLGQIVIRPEVGYVDLHGWIEDEVARGNVAASDEDRQRLQSAVLKPASTHDGALA